jgi:hypothetical protein
MANTLLLALGVILVACFGLPGEALAGYCASLSDCVSGDQTGAAAVLIGSGAVGGLIGVVAMDDGFIGGGGTMEVEDLGLDEPPDDTPPDDPEPPSEDYPEGRFGRMA